MAIEPAIANLPTIYQNAAYSVQMRLTDRMRDATIDSSGTIESQCHGLAIGAKVVLLAQLPAASLCGAILNQVYYVSPLDFSVSTLRLSTSPSGGSVLNISATGDQRFYLAQPVSIVNYVIDADICKKQTNVRVQVASFNCVVAAATEGLFSLKLDPATTVCIAAGSYAYDVSMTPSNGDRFYAVRGDVPVTSTQSRT